LGLEGDFVTDTAPIALQNSALRLFAAGEPPPITERLVRALEAHRAASAADIATYRQVAHDLNEPVVELLVGMIVDDEQRHDALLHSMIRRVQEEVEFVASPGAVPVPSGTGAMTGDAANQAAIAVRGLIRNEHEGSRHLRHLARQEPTLYGGLYPVLLETIARDSEKHATILRYLLRRVDERAR
jgi:rubrerythrin